LVTLSGCLLKASHVGALKSFLKAVGGIGW
jgi:hypothetical protein